MKAKFKIGDKVKCSKKCSKSYSYFFNGCKKITDIEHFCDRYVYIVNNKYPIDCIGYYSYELDKVK